MIKLDFSLQACPICGTVDNFIILNNNDRYGMKISTVGCGVCGLIQTNPRLKDESVNEFYAKYYRLFYQGCMTPSIEYINKNNKKTRMLDTCTFLKNHISDLRGNLLDIGCSEGVFFEACVHNGIDCRLYGVEPNHEFREYAKQNCLIDDIWPNINDVDINFDIIVMIHVFEHLVSPDQYLAMIRGALKDNGILYLEIPDVEEYSSIADLHIAHVFHYSIDSIRIILNKFGFDIIFIEKFQPIAHPKSIRVLCMKKPVYPTDFNYSASCLGWDAVRNLRSRLYLFRRSVSRFIRKII